MAVIDVRQVLHSASREGELDEHAQRRYMETWYVETDDPLDGPQVVGDAPGVPRLFAYYVNGNDRDLGSRLKRIRPRRMAGETMKWEVELEYDSMLHREGEGERDPMLRPPTVRWATSAYQAVATHDIFGKPLLNSAKDEFDPPAMKDDSRLSLTITRNESNFVVALGFSYIDCVNSDPFFVGAPGEAKMISVESDLISENAITFWKTTYQIHFRRTITSPGATILNPQTGNVVTNIKPWNITVLDVGFNEVAAGGAKNRILMTDKTRCVQPIRLDGSGTHLSPFDAPHSASWYLSYQVYAEKPFAALGLP